jgi:hypothetical protein
VFAGGEDEEVVVVVVNEDEGWSYTRRRNSNRNNKEPKRKTRYLCSEVYQMADELPRLDEKSVGLKNRDL